MCLMENSSRNAVMENIMALSNLTDDSMNDNISSPVNVTYLEMEFGIVLNATEPMMENNQVIILLNDLQVLTEQLAGSIGENSFAEWQVKMEDLHNQSQSAGGYLCYGFSDCIVTIGETISYLLHLTPLPEATTLLTNLQEAETDLLDLAIQTNLTMDEAISKMDKMLLVLEEFLQLNYWCASAPNITVQPEKRIATTENGTVTLYCEAESLVPVNYKWKKGSTDVPGANSSTLVLQDIKFADADNYTCIATNHIGSATSLNASVEVQEFPSLTLQPDHQDIYLWDQNGAQFKCNVAGVPNPGIRWYYRPHDQEEFAIVPNKSTNIYTIPNTVPEHEGVYYCEAYNEQGAVQSRQVNLIVLRTSVAQLTQPFTLNVAIITDGNVDAVVEEALNITLGSGMIDSLQNVLVQHLITVVNNLLSLQRTSLEDVTITELDDMLLSISFALYSYNISYSDVNGEDLFYVAPGARSEWNDVLDELVNLLQNESMIVSDGMDAYQTSSSSLLMGDIRLGCPRGSAVYDDNQFLCVSCPAGSYQVDNRITLVNGDGSETVVVMPDCVACPINTYQYIQGQTQCASCPDHHITHSNSTRLLEDCIMMCPPGEYSDDGLVPCNKCPIGQYQSSHGQLECVECPVNHNTRNTGTQQMEDCLPLCPPGTYSSDRFEPCLECPCGTYSDMFGTMQCNNCSTIGAPQDQCTGIFKIVMVVKKTKRVEYQLWLLQLVLVGE
ncbi:uncharacterized protein [Dysidea avara]|uniref:uncharacterized protein isoform X2 n=1 Tax=Dysidea avara TaxID=196820 RepID=UPI0033188FCC